MNQIANEFILKPKKHMNESAPEDDVIRSLVRLKKRAPESTSSEASSLEATSPEA